MRATFSSKLCVTATTGGQARTRAISRASAAISSPLPASRSTTTTVALATSSVSPSAAIRPVTMVSSIALEVPNVARAERSNSASAVSTTTRVRFESGLELRPIRITIDPAYFTGAADWVTVGPTGVVLFGAFEVG